MPSPPLRVPRKLLLWPELLLSYWFQLVLMSFMLSMACIWPMPPSPPAPTVLPSWLLLALLLLIFFKFEAKLPDVFSSDYG